MEDNTYEIELMIDNVQNIYSLAQEWAREGELVPSDAEAFVRAYIPENNVIDYCIDYQRIADCINETIKG